MFPSSNLVVHITFSLVLSRCCMTFKEIMISPAFFLLRLGFEIWKDVMFLESLIKHVQQISLG